MTQPRGSQRGGAGRLRDRVSLQRRILTPDGYGNQEGAWQEQFRCAARIVALRGREEVLAQRLQGLQPAAVTIYSSQQARQVTPDWRVVDARTGQAYNVRSVSPAEAGDFIELICEAGGADG